MSYARATGCQTAFRLIPAVVLLAALTGCSGYRNMRRTGGAAQGVARTYPQYAGRAVRVERSGMEIDDGDTFVYKGVTVRILGIDTPEITHPEHGFFEDQDYGREATARAVEIFDAAGVIEYVPDSLDPYGRTLGQVFVDGESFAVMMIEAHLAYESVTYYGDNGFPDIAKLIRAAAEKAGPPPFQEPYIWRREHKREPVTSGH